MWKNVCAITWANSETNLGRKGISCKAVSNALLKRSCKLLLKGGGEIMFVRVGKAKDVVNNEMRVFDVAGTKVAVASALGHLYAFDDTCTHRGCSLAEGKLD